MLCNAKAIFRGILITAKGIPSVIPGDYIIDEIAACAVNSVWPTLLLRLKYPKELFSIAKHLIDEYSARQVFLYAMHGIPSIKSNVKLHY